MPNSQKDIYIDKSKSKLKDKATFCYTICIKYLMYFKVTRNKITACTYTILVSRNNFRLGLGVFEWIYRFVQGFYAWRKGNEWQRRVSVCKPEALVTFFNGQQTLFFFFFFYSIQTPWFFLPLKTGGGKQSQQVAKETSDFNVSENLFRLTGRLMLLLLLFFFQFSLLSVGTYLG